MRLEAGAQPEVILKDAAALIEQRGWCQGTGFTVAGEVCAFVAINEVSPGDPLGRAKAYELLQSRIRKTQRSCSIMVWNDDPKRTKAEVLATMRGER